MEQPAKPYVQQSLTVLPKADHRHPALERAQVEARRVLLELARPEQEQS